MKLNTHLPGYPEIPVLDVYLREMKTHSHTKIFTRKFIAALLMTAKIGNKLNVHHQENKRNVMYSVMPFRSKKE